MIDKEYDKYFDYHTKNYKYISFLAENNSITLLNEGSKVSSIKYDFGQNINDNTAINVVYLKNTED